MSSKDEVWTAGASKPDWAPDTQKAANLVSQKLLEHRVVHFTRYLQLKWGEEMGVGP